MNGTHAEMLNEAEFTLLKALRALHYGALQVTVHDARIVQIEKTEKIRFPGGPKG